MNLLIALVTGSMFAVGLFQLLRRNIVRSAIGLIILSNAINLFLLSTGAYNGNVPPMLA
jgi:multicomponent Na+:H+ antiporter subunit C